MKLLSFDVGGTFIKWAYMDSYTILKQGKVPTPKTNFEDYLNALQSVVNQFEDVKGLAFSLQGTIDKKTGFMVQGGSLKYNSNRFYQKEVEEFFGLPISLENDSKSGAICEHVLGALKDVQNGAMIVIGTGLGCTFVLNGDIYHGSHNSAGEISILLAGDLFEEKTHAFLAEKSSSVAMVDMAKKTFNDDTLDGVRFMDMVANGNEQANSILDRYLNQLAKAIFNIQIINDLERIVIGGGISANALYMKRLQDKLTSYYEAIPFPIPRVELVPSTRGNDANLLGAAITFYKEHE